MTELPESLRLVASAIARRILAEHGYIVPDEYDFSVATHPREKAAYRSAVGSIQVLDEWLIDYCGESICDLFHCYDSAPEE